MHQDDEEVLAPEDLAVVDPLAGFLAMNPLPRICYILTHRLNTEAVQPLLSVLISCARSSPSAALAVVKTPGMLEAFSAILNSNNVTYSKPSQHQVDQQQQQQHQGQDTTAPEQQQQQQRVDLRLSVLHLVRLMCQASPSAAHLLHTAGVLTHAQAVLAVHTISGSSLNISSSGSISVTSLLLQLEALTLWRVAVVQVRSTKADTDMLLYMFLLA